MKVLTVDDSKAVQSFLKLCLPAPEYELVSALSGEEALELILKDNAPSNYDLILLDWEMPGLTGPEVLTKITESQVSTPVIMLTSRNRPEDIKMVLEIGAKEYIMKPFTGDLVQEKIAQVLEAGI